MRGVGPMVSALFQAVRVRFPARVIVSLSYQAYKSTAANTWGSLKARLHVRFLSRQLDAIFVALKLHQVSNMFETPATSRRQIALKIAPGLHVRF